METLNYEVLAKSGYQGYILKDAPEKVLQFGEGNFLRAFVDYWFDVSNEKAGWNGKCCLVQPIAPGLAKLMNAQQGLYTLYLRGRQHAHDGRGHRRTRRQQCGKLFLEVGRRGLGGAGRHLRAPLRQEGAAGGLGGNVTGRYRVRHPQVHLRRTAGGRAEVVHPATDIGR